MPINHRTTELDGLVGVVTGGGRGIGRATAELLAAHGAEVVVAARTEAELASVSATSPTIRAVACDVADPVSVECLFSQVDHVFGRLDIVVCSHGTYPGVRRVTEIALEDLQRTIDVNFTGTFLCAQRAARLMLAGGTGGSVVAVSSMNALASRYGAADYDASKAAVNGLVRAFAVDLAPAGISVNAIAPGWIRTSMSEPGLRDLEGMALNPRQSVGEPDDVARAAVWLCDPRNRFVTGATLVIDGGQTAMLPLPWRAEEVR